MWLAFNLLCNIYSSKWPYIILVRIQHNYLCFYPSRQCSCCPEVNFTRPIMYLELSEVAVHFCPVHYSCRHPNRSGTSGENRAHFWEIMSQFAKSPPAWARSSMCCFSGSGSCGFTFDVMDTATSPGSWALCWVSGSKRTHFWPHNKLDSWVSILF